MKITGFALAVMSLLSLTLVAPQAEAKPGGCLKYGAAGAVAGHLSGHHGIKGAIVGCATGMYIRHQYKEQMKEKAHEPQPDNAPPPPGSPY